MAKKKAASRQIMTRRKVVEPVMLVKLMDTIGPTKAAKSIGASTTLVHKAKKDGGVNQVVELAAAYVLEHLSDTGTSRTAAAAPTARPSAPSAGVFTGIVPADKADTFRQLAAALGVTLA